MSVEVEVGSNMSNERAPGCLGELLGMKNYPDIGGIRIKP